MGGLDNGTFISSADNEFIAQIEPMIQSHIAFIDSTSTASTRPEVGYCTMGVGLCSIKKTKTK